MSATTSQGKLSKGARNTIVAIVVAIIVLALAWFVYGYVSEDIREQSAVSMRNTILESAKQCCAIEGAYPPSLAYLEENYGLTINHNDYLVTYEIYAENIVPSVVVLPR